jgi:hypothetical protein
MCSHVATADERWIFERVAFYIRKSWCVPDAIAQAKADRRALVLKLNARDTAKAACAFVEERARGRGRNV